jgi:hypothetical protein
MGRSQRRLFVLAFPLFMVGYATFVFFRKQYAAVILPPLFVAVLLGGRAVEITFPKWRDAWATFLACAVVGLTILALPEINTKTKNNPLDQITPTPLLSVFEAEVRKLPHTPAIVLVYHAAGQNVTRHEPAYNNDVAWPDDARVVRAHDLGERNVELFRYYARVQPARHVYRFDKATRKMSDLGPVTVLAAAPSQK